MKFYYRTKGVVLYFLLCTITISCSRKTNSSEQEDKTLKKGVELNKSYNPVVYFEIPVSDIERATKFYSSVFNFKFERDTIDKNEMALFPFVESNYGISGALAKGEIYKPTKNGVVIYFNSDNIDETLLLAIKNGGHILYPKTSIGDLGFVAELEDSEGNRIALHQSVKQQ